MKEFTCHIPQQQMDDLKSRLRQVRWPDEIKESGWRFGANLSYMKDLTDHWLNQFDWREVEDEFQRDAEKWYENEGAYSHLQRTKALTAAYGLNDSPAGLCAWILEKFYFWSDCEQDIESLFTKDDLLANVSLYWFTQTIHSSMRLYYENSQVPLHFSRDDYVNTPVGIARFHKEEPFPPRRFIERGYHVKHWTEFSKGGHFAALECPVELANDIRNFTRSILS